MNHNEIINCSKVGHVRLKNMAHALAHYMPQIGECAGLIYVGANTGQELPVCKQYAQKIYAFEPISDPSVWQQLIQHEDETTTCFNYALNDHDGISIMWPASNNFESSSLYPPCTHVGEFPDVKFHMPIQVESRRLDSFEFHSECDVIIMDVQGAELQVLQGLHDFSNVKMIILEYVSAHMYQACCTFDQLHEKLKNEGFTYYECFDVYNNPSTFAYAGNAVFVRNGLIGEQHGT